MQENRSADKAQEYWQPDEASAKTESSVTPDAQMQERQAKARVRHRMIGGLVLLATAVVFLPLVFETPAIDTQEEAQTRIPDIPKEPLEKLELVVNRPEPVSMGKGPLKDLTQPNDIGEETTTPAPVDDDEMQVPGTLFIQVLATSSERGAMREMAKYQAMGLPVYAVKVQKKSATLWRVRLGLFKTKAEAEKVVQYLNSQNISHMPIQVEKTETRAIERIKPAQTLKAATQNANEAAKHATPSESTVKKTQDNSQKSVIKSAGSTQKAPASSSSVTNKSKAQTTKSSGSKTSSQPASKAPKPSAKSQGQKQTKVDDDPLAGMIRNAERDFIAEQLARERAQNNKP